MHVQFEYITNLQYEVKRLEKLVESFRSGEKYIRMKEEFRKITDGLKREIRRLKAELAAAHAETLRVRSFWIQACEDLEKEKDAQLARKEREVKKTKEALYRAQGERDEALGKLREKNRELYDIDSQ